jgi:hypothetical protein
MFPVRYGQTYRVDCWVMYPVARVSINRYRNLRMQQMSVLVFCALLTPFVAYEGFYIQYSIDYRVELSFN